MFRRSSFQESGYAEPRDVGFERIALCGRVRFPILSWGWIGGLGVLVSAMVYLPEVMTPAQGEAGRRPFGTHTNWVESVVFSPGGRWLATAGGDSSAYVWDVERGTLAMVLDEAPESERIFSRRAAFTRDGATLAVSRDDGLVTLWDLASGSPQRHIRASTEVIRGLAFSPDGQLLATGSTDDGIVLWDAATLRRRMVLLAKSRAVNCVAFSPDGRTLASASVDGTTRLWDVASGNNVRTLSTSMPSYRSVVCVAFSPDGRVLATACPEVGITLWDALTGRRLETHQGCQRGAMTLSFSPVDGRLAWGSTDGTIELWDDRGQRRLSVWQGHSGGVVALAFSPDGRTLASGGNDATVRLWNVSKFNGLRYAASIPPARDPPSLALMELRK